MISKGERAPPFPLVCNRFLNHNKNVIPFSIGKRDDVFAYSIGFTEYGIGILLL